MTCTFFGHRDAPQSIWDSLYDTVRELIEHDHVDTFYVGYQGNFDRMVLSVLHRMEADFPSIQYSVVLPYMPQEKKNAAMVPWENTIYPEGLECVPPRFAISWRNKWMIRNSDVVVCYMTHSAGGTAQAIRYAANRQKRIIYIPRKSTTADSQSSQDSVCAQKQM